MAAINKNFVIKNGLEVNTNLILADSQTNKVGIGTTVPQYLLHVNGGIGVTNLYVSGIATITTGIVTNLTSTNLNVTGIGTIVTGNITNLTNTNLNVTGIATIATLNATGIGVTNLTVYNNLSVGGVSTFTNGPVLIGSGTSTGTASQRLQVTGGTYVSGNLGIGSTNPTSKLHVVGDVRITGVVTATTFSGNVNAGVGTITILTGTSGTITNLTGTAGTITTLNSTSGTITNLTGTSGTITTLSSTNGTITNLTGTSGTITKFNSTSGTITNLTGTAGTITTLNSTSGTITNLTGTAATIGTVKIVSGIITATSGVVTYFGDGSYLTGTASSPNLQTVLNTGNTSSTGINVTGVITATSFVGSGANLTGIANTANIVSTAITTGILNVGTGLTLSSSGINVTGVITATSFVGALTGTATSTTNIPNLTGAITSVNTTTSLGSFTSLQLSTALTDETGSGANVFATSPTLVTPALGSATATSIVVGSGVTINTSGINVTGVVTATSFVGNGSGLTGAGSTVFIDTTTNQEFFPLFTATTSGTITASGITTSKLTYNTSTGAMTAVDFNSTSDINLKENIHTVGNALEITEQLRGVSFDWKETGRSSYGVIAQELEEVLPELVKQGEVKSVNYNGIIGVLIEAIKELKKEVEDLKNTK